MNEPAAVIVGVGAPAGLGAALARRFAREGLKVFLAARTPERIEAAAADIQAKGGKARAIAADATSEEDISRLFETASSEAVLEAVAFNAGSNLMASALDTDAAAFETLWRQNALGGFLTGREAVRRMLPQGRGTLLFTGATASLRARPPFLAFAAAKAALRAVAQGFAREFGPRGLHVAHVIIDGVIAGDSAYRRFPEVARTKGADGLLDPGEIADVFWHLHCQPRSTWTHELDLRPFKEPF